MALGYDGPCAQRETQKPLTQLERIEKALEKNNEERARLEAAKRFIVANPDFQGFLDTMGSF